MKKNIEQLNRYYHKLIYPLHHDFYFGTLDRGPIIIDKKSLTYEVIRVYNDLELLDRKLIPVYNKSENILIKTYIENFRDNMSYNLFLDIIK